MPSIPSLPIQGEVEEDCDLSQTPSAVGSEDIPQDVDYSSYTLDELKKEAKERGVEGYSKLKKAEIIELLN